MKKLFLLFALFATTLGFCIVEPVPHISPVHVSEPVVHVSTSHVSEPVAHVNTVHETPMYHPVETVNESHIYQNRTTSLYYYLIMNNHTHKYDTVSAPTKEELKSKVIKTTKSDEADLLGLIIFLIGVSFFIFILLLFSDSKATRY